MKKFLTILFCAGMVLPMFGQKALVEQAAKLSGKPAQLNEARNLIKQAMSNPETQNDARTYYIAGKIEFDAYDNAFKTQMINPGDPSAQPDVMGKELMDGYNYFLKALPLDSLPNEKGQVKPRFSKDIYNKLWGHANDFFTIGGEYYNSQMYYPQAYDAFMIYGELPNTVLAGHGGETISPEQVATAFFNAGLSAYQGNKLDESALGFKKARLAGYQQPEAYIYEIACLQTIGQQDESRLPEIQEKIMDVATAGNEKFGLEQPIFLNNMINSLVSENKMDESINLLNGIIAENPDMPALYGLRGFVYDRMEKDDLSEADYRKAASLPDVDYDTLKNASKKLFRVGTTKLNDIEGSSAEANAARQNIKENYFEEALRIANQAAPMSNGDPDLQNVLDSLDYALTTYFSK
ncbi:MAG: hypothetical protein J1E78_02365 [Muribaculaceae bacterium]|nr:hypothetical protein [Muribaculaceae bacterium]